MDNNKENIKLYTDCAMVCDGKIQALNELSSAILKNDAVLEAITEYCE